MITVLCGNSKTVYHFPTAIKTCRQIECPADHCSKPNNSERGGPDLCVLGEKDGQVVCLASFASVLSALYCSCKEEGCEHCDIEHAAIQPILERWAHLVEPEEKKIARLKQEHRNQVLAEAGKPIPYEEDDRTDAQRLHDRIQTYAPDALKKTKLWGRHKIGGFIKAKDFPEIMAATGQDSLLPEPDHKPQA